MKQWSDYMFENFNTIDFVILGTSIFMNIVFVVCIIVLIIKKGNKKTVLDTIEEVKVIKVNDNEEVTAFEEIIEAMQKDLDSEKENAVELFEQEQEEKAIISYQELLNAKNKVDAKTEKFELFDEVKDFKEEKGENVIEKPKATPKLATASETKFTNSEFVSPVFGKMDRNLKSNVQIQVNADKNHDNYDLEKTLNIEPLTEEIKKNNDFLNALKEFRKNL